MHSNHSHSHEFSNSCGHRKGCAQLQQNEFRQAFFHPPNPLYIIWDPQQGILCQHISRSFQGTCCNMINCLQQVSIPCHQNQATLLTWQNLEMLPPWQNQATCPLWQPTASWYHVGANVIPSVGLEEECTSGQPNSSWHGLGAPHMGHWHLSSAEPLPDHNGFTIHPTRVTSRTDQRTTLIVKNIPTKMTQLRFKAMLCNDFIGKFDFLYVPHDWKTGGSLGYAFVNLNQVEDVLPFYERFHNLKLSNSNSTKVWAVCYARIQGRIELEAHFASRTINRNISPELGFSCAPTEIEAQTSVPGSVNVSANQANKPGETRRMRRGRARAQN